MSCSPSPSSSGNSRVSAFTSIRRRAPRCRCCACRPRSASWRRRPQWRFCGWRWGGQSGERNRAMTAQLEFRDLTLGYDRHPAVHHLSGTVDSGSLMAVIGPNGAGKSTLFKGTAGLLAPLSGAIERNGLARHEIAYLPQAAEIDRSFPIHVYDLVAMGLWRRTGAFGAIGKSERDKIHGAIAA